jgi:hypothetical protein
VEKHRLWRRAVRALVAEAAALGLCYLIPLFLT